jgi:hypothetical protein
MVSFKSLFDSLAPSAPVLAQGLYLIAALLVLWAVVSVWSSRRLTLPLAWALASLAAVLIDPHLVDYDLTVLVAAGVIALPLLRAAQWLVVALYPALLLRLAIPLGDHSLQISVIVLAALAWVGFAANRTLCSARAADGERRDPLPQLRRFSGGGH